MSYSGIHKNHRLIRARTNLGLSLDEVAEKIRLQPERFELYESLDSWPRDRNLTKICRFYHEPKEKLFPGWLKHFYEIKKQLKASHINEREIVMPGWSIDYRVRLVKNKESCTRDATTIVHKILKTLDERELAIITKRCGYKCHKCTLSQIGEEFNISKQSVEQIEHKVKEKLRFAIKLDESA